MDDASDQPETSGGDGLTSGPPTSFGTVPSTFRAAPTVPSLPPGPPDPPSIAPAGSRPDSAPTDGARPVPTLASMAAVGAGVLVAAGLFFLLGELDGIDQRGVALAICVLFLALGVALSTINRSNRAAAAGVAISALAVVPFTVYLFANADVFGELSGGQVDGNPWDGIRGVVTLMLATAAILWLLGYVLNPARRFGFYLGAALLAIWLIPIINIQISATEDLFASVGVGTTFEPVPLDPGSDFDSGFDEDPGSSFDSGFDQGSGSDFTFDEPDFADPSTKLGLVSLAFGAGYLALAALRDRRGDARMATAALAPAVLILVYALSLLTAHVGWFGIGALAIVVGGAILAVGLHGSRRASSWIGVAVATIGLGWLVVRPLQDSPRAMGGALTLVGVAIALAVGLTGRRPPVEGAPPTAADGVPFGSTGPTTGFGAPLAPAGPPLGSPAPTGPPASTPTFLPPVPPAGPPAPHPPAGPSPTEERPPWSHP